MFLKCLKNKNYSCQEIRISFQLREALEGAGQDSDDHWYYAILGVKTVSDVLSGVGSIISGTGTLAGAAGRLAESFANLVDLGTVAIGQGIIALEKGSVKLYDFLKDKYVGQPEVLPEYDYMAVKFLGLTPQEQRTALGYKISEKTFALMHYEYRMAVLDALMYQLQAFYTPALNDFAKVEYEIETRNRIQWKNDNQKQKLREKISTKRKLLADGNLADSTMKAILLTEMENDEKALEQLEGETTKDVMWEMPQTQQVEFPQGSGKYLTRYLPGRKKVKVNLDTLYKSMGVYVSGFEPLLKKYFKEKVKLKYWSEKANEGASKSGFMDAAKEASDIVNYRVSLLDRVKLIQDNAKIEFDKVPTVPLYHLMVNPFEVRQNAVGTNNVSKDYISWKMVKRVPEKLKNFGCYVGKDSNGGSMIYKDGVLGKFNFTIGQAGDISTQYPNNVQKYLPPGADPNNKNAWNPPIP